MLLFKLRRIIRCSFKLRCPECGEGKLYEKRFRMFPVCTVCGLKFEREQGYFIGAMYINYGATVFIAFPGYFALGLITHIPFFINFGIWTLVSAIFPIFFYRYSRSLWLNIDYSINQSS